MPTVDLAASAPLRAARRQAARVVATGLVAGSAHTPPAKVSPIFLLGCGRSGTTIVGTLLGSHPKVRYLNEPRFLWRVIDPVSDFWTEDNTNGRPLAMHAEHATPAVVGRARRSFARLARLPRRREVVEKLPINAFRLPYLDELFPAARYCFVRRHGLEVAHSMAAAPGWHDAAGHRWRSLRAHAVTSGFDESFLDRCHDEVAKGLVEWTLSMARTESKRQALDGSGRCVGAADYRDICADPVGQLGSWVRSFGGDGEFQQWSGRVSGLISAPCQRAKDLVWPSAIHPLTIEMLDRFSYPRP